MFFFASGIRQWNKESKLLIKGFCKTVSIPDGTFGFIVWHKATNVGKRVGRRQVNHIDLVTEWYFFRLFRIIGKIDHTGIWSQVTQPEMSKWQPSPFSFCQNLVIPLGQWWEGKPCVLRRKGILSVFRFIAKWYQIMLASVWHLWSL